MNMIHVPFWTYCTLDRIINIIMIIICSGKDKKSLLFILQLNIQHWLEKPFQIHMKDHLKNGQNHINQQCLHHFCLSFSIYLINNTYPRFL